MKKEISLTKRFNHILIIISLVTFTVTSLLIAFININNKKSDYASLMKRTVTAYKQLLTKSFLDYKVHINNAKKNLYSRDPEAFYAYLEKYLSYSHQQDIFYVINKDKTIIWIEEPYKAYLGFSLADYQKVNYAQVHQSFISLHPVITLSFHLGNGEQLIIEKDTRYLIDLIKKFQSVNVFLRGQFFILNNNGIVIYHQRQDYIDSRYNLGFELKEWTKPDRFGLRQFQHNNKRMICYQDKLTFPRNWALYYALPYSVLFESFIRHWLSTLLLIAILITLIIIVLRILMGRYIAGPIGNIVGQLAHIHTGNERIEIQSGRQQNIREINQITTAVTRMMENIRKSGRELHKRQEILKTVTEHSLDWSYWISPEKKLIYTSPNVYDLTGYTADEFYSNPDLMDEIVFPDDQIFWKDHSHKRSGKGHIEPIELRIVHKDGSVKWLRHVCQIIKDKQGHNLGIRGSNSDITLRKKAELAFNEQRNRLETTLRSIGDGVIATDLNKKIILLNHSAEKLCGWKQAEALHKEISLVLNLKSDTPSITFDQFLDKVLAKKQALEFPQNAILISRQGKKFLINDSAAPIFDAQNNITGIVVVFRDVTQRVKMEEELAKMNKLESVGILAGGIAHDFNNILTAILGNVMLASELEKNEKIKHRLREAEKAALRAKDLSDQLLTFSKGGNPILEPTSIQSIIEDSCSFALSGSNAKLILKIAPDLHPAYADAGQINQVLHNLVLNAAQAIPDSGTIEVRACNEEVDAKSSLPLKNGTYIKIVIRDNGIGIPEDDLDKIFDPYFTTKKSGNGLGLSSTFSIIKKHKGHIFVESESGSGTSFTIYLPASLKNSAKPKKRSNTSNMKGNGKILIMDDEAEIRDILGEILKLSGYSPEFSKDGKQAIQMYKTSIEHGEKYKAIIMDLTIPGGLGGKEAIKELLELDKDVIAIVSSGYSNDPVMSRYKEYGFKAVIKKPYQLNEIRNTLTKILT